MPNNELARTFDIFEGNDNGYHLVVPVRGQNTKEMTNCLRDEYTYMTNATKNCVFQTLARNNSGATQLLACLDPSKYVSK